MKYEYLIEDFSGTAPTKPLEVEINRFAKEGYRLLSLTDYGTGTGWWWIAVFERPSADERNAPCP
jgi:hypothetical protein